MNQRNYTFIAKEIESIIRNLAAILWSIARLIWGQEITEARKGGREGQDN